MIYSLFGMSIHFGMPSVALNEFMPLETSPSPCPFEHLHHLPYAYHKVVCILLD